MQGWTGEHRTVRATLRAVLTGPQLLGFIPALTLGGYWYAGEAGLIILALVLPLCMAVVGIVVPAEAAPREMRDPVTGLPLTEAGVRRASGLLTSSVTRHETTACLAISIDEFAEIAARHGPETGTTILQVCTDRIRSVIRDNDFIFRLDGPRFGLIVASNRRADLETLIQLSSRIQAVLEDPIVVDGMRVFISVSVGFATPRKLADPTGAALVEAAIDALRDAMQHGTGMIRAFSAEIQGRAKDRGQLAADLPSALETGQIRPYFQPQVCAATNEITGFEVLARWKHPERGIVPPGEFLTAAEEQGLLERLGEVMLYHTLNALRAWDAAGVHVPNLSVNFTAEELRNPAIVEKIRWELDRFDIVPGRLTIEVLETVIAQTSNDTIVRNLRAFAELGCRIDLDDFGTGHASIAAIKRFSVHRIKIDRSFVASVDADIDQQNIVAAIITLARRLELDTLAEGVETEEELGVIRRLGCDCVQGYHIARPMPFEDVEAWVEEHEKSGTGPGSAMEAADPETDRSDMPSGRGMLA